MQSGELKESINASGERVFGTRVCFSFCGDQAFLHDYSHMFLVGYLG